MNKKADNGSERRNDFLKNVLSRSNVAIVITIYVLVSISAFTYGLLESNCTLVAEIFLFIGGYVFYTLVEYLIHRFVFHSSWPVLRGSWSAVLHKLHHDHSRDKDQLAIPLAMALVVAVVIYCLFWVVMRTYAPFFFSGFLIGYSTYFLMHFLIHTKQFPRHVLRNLWVHHYNHHYKNERKCFGIISTIWDRLFGTLSMKDD